MRTGSDAVEGESTPPRHGWSVAVPGSSANLGSGFDCLAVAVDLPFRLARRSEAPDGFHRVEPTHPAALAYRAAGGSAPDRNLWWHSPIPPGRGLGFSGAARVAGGFLARLEGGEDVPAARRRAFEVAAELEGHADNAAASAFGGVTVAAGGQALSVPVHPRCGELRLVVWSPASSTSTDASRGRLEDTVPRGDAVFNIGRAALWVAALGAGDVASMRTAAEDRVHQARRLAELPASAEVMAALGASDAVAVWLSGSGPSIAALVKPDDAATTAALPLGATGVPGVVRLLEVDRLGARVDPEI